MLNPIQETDKCQAQPLSANMCQRFEPKPSCYYIFRQTLYQSYHYRKQNLLLNEKDLRGVFLSEKKRVYDPSQLILMTRCSTGNDSKLIIPELGVQVVIIITVTWQQLQRSDLNLALHMSLNQTNNQMPTIYLIKIRTI